MPQIISHNKTTVLDIIAKTDGSPIGGIVICLSAGIFNILGAVRNWDWFHDCTSIDTLLGRSAARVFFGLLGSFFIAFAIILGFLHYA